MPKKQLRVLITGGAGFIGANTASHYLSKGHRVTIFDDLSRPGVETNLKWLKSQALKDQLEIIKASVTNFPKLEKHIAKKHLVFHFAGQTAVTTSIKDPRRDFQCNALGTFNVLEAIRTVNPRAIMIYSSTNKVYGAVGRVNAKRRGKRYYSVESPSIDESEQLNFYSPYGCSKGTGDQYTHDYARIYGLKTIVFRQSCIYGTHQFGVEDQGWLAHFAAQAIKGNTINIFGDGKQVRDILFITDLISAFEKAIKYIHITAGQIYNIGGGIYNTISLLELIDQLESLSGHTIRTKFFPARQGDQKVYISNIDKAQRDLNWHPLVSTKQGVTKLYSWLHQYLHSSSHG